jgi:hypothetical protein
MYIIDKHIAAFDQPVYLKLAPLRQSVITISLGLLVKELKVKVSG